MPGRRLIRRLPRHALIIGAAWLLAIVAADAAIAGVPFHPPALLLQAAWTPVGALSVIFGYLLGRQRDLADFLIAAALGTITLMLGVDATYITMLSVPRAGGGGGCGAGCGCLLILFMIGPAAAAIVGFPLLASALGIGVLAAFLGVKSSRGGRMATGALAVAAAVLFWFAAGVVAASSYWTDENTVPLTRAGVVGAWAGPHGATLRFSPDGRFAAQHLPSDFGDGAEAGNIPAQGSGTWQVSGPADPDGSAVQLTFTNHSGADLETEREGKTLALFYYVGDPDDDQQVQFLKQPG